MKELIRTYFTLSKSDRLFRSLRRVSPILFETRERHGSTLYERAHVYIRLNINIYIRGLYTRMRTGWKVKSRASRKRNKETRGLFSPLFLFASSFFPPPPFRPSHSLSPLFRSRIRGFLGWRTRSLAATYRELKLTLRWLPAVRK